MKEAPKPPRTFHKFVIDGVALVVPKKRGFPLGACPCAALAIPAAVENSMGALPQRHLLDLPLWCPRGACLFGCLPTLPLALLLPPSPRPPSPPGKGEIFLFSYARGSAPCIPGVEPARHWLFLPLWKIKGGVPSLSPAAPAFSLLSCPLSPPTPFPGGEGGDQKFISPGASPPAPLH